LGRRRERMGVTPMESRRRGSRPGRHGEEHGSLLLLPWDACCAMEKKTGRLLWRLEKNEGWECKNASTCKEMTPIYREALGLGFS
jgi:hypothetical protein